MKNILARLAAARLAILAVIALAITVVTGRASAAVDADITTMITDATSVFTGVKGFVLAAVAFFLLLGFVGWLRRKK